MRRILAIAGITIRNAIRSRVVLVLGMALLVVTVVIPLTVKSDGTLHGELQIILRYSLGAASMLLALATVWAGCAAISLEIEHRRIHMVAVKPVPRSHIWLGSWLGLIVLNTVLLLFVGAINYGFIRWRLAREATSKSQREAVRQRLLTARRALQAPPPDVEVEVEQAFRQMKAEGRMAPNFPEEQYRKALRDQYRQRARSAAPGEKLVWIFPEFEWPRQNAPALLRYRFAISELSFEDVRGQWSIRRESGSQGYEMSGEAAPQRNHSIEIPLEILRGDGSVIVEFLNAHNRPITVFFDPDHGVTLLVPASGFASNYARALLMILFHLMFLAALGTAMGTLFSMPVASFVTWSLVFLLAVAGFMENLSVQFVPLGDPHSRSAIQNAVNAAFRVFFTALQKILGPLRQADPLDMLAEGLWLSSDGVLRIFMTKIALYSGVLALFSFWVFNRRELALPSS